MQTLVFNSCYPCTFACSFEQAFVNDLCMSKYHVSAVFASSVDKHTCQFCIAIS